MRSAFMTSSGDAFVLLNALHYYENVWKDEVDELWVALNSTMERNVMCQLISLFPKGVKFIYLNQRLGYGKPLNLLLECSPKGSVMLLEDDTIIFKKGVVTKYFDLLEKYDLIGSPRMSCTKEVAEALRLEFDLDYSGWGDKGPMFWPCFLWAKKELLLQTDRNFDPTPWGDTFAWMSVQLRRLKPNILEIPQYHCSPDDFENKKYGRGIFDGECGYMHLGSLSSGIESYLLDDKNTPLTDREANIPSLNPKDIENTSEMQRRAMWWWHCFHKVRGSMPWEFEKVYITAWRSMAKRGGLDVDLMNKWMELYLDEIGETYRHPITL